MKKIFTFVLLLSFASLAQQKSEPPFTVEISECVGMNRAAGEYRVSGKIIEKMSQKTCPFDWFLSTESKNDPYEFSLEKCGWNVDGYVYFGWDEAFIVSGKLLTKPETVIYKKPRCS